MPLSFWNFPKGKKMNRAWIKLNSYLNGDALHIRYTLKTDDITEGNAPFSMPYNDRKGYFDKNGRCEKIDANVTVSAFNGGIKLVLKTNAEDISQFGLSLPINFMGKKGGGGWQNQYLLNSVYTSKGNKYKYCYLTNPNGKNLIIFPKGKCDGWKCDYSSEYCPGHFFLELEFLANFDKVYATGSKNKRLELYIFEVANFEKGLDVLCKTLNTSAISFAENSVRLGEEITLRVHGNCDKVRYCNEYLAPKNKKITVRGKKYGLNAVYPYIGKNRGLECMFYAYDDIKKVYKRSLDAVNDVDLARISGNLCESKCWMSAMLRYMQRYGKNGCSAFEKRLEETFKTVMQKDETKAVPRVTVLNKPHGNEPAYSIYKSGRIQELLFGVTIFTDAYRLTGKEEFLTYLTGALDGVLSHHFDDGMIYTGFLNGEKEDYTTVCCLIIPFIDASLLLKQSHPALAKKYAEAAGKIAHYLYHRKGFHTEAWVSDKTEPEMEDGSISCSALSLLYYCAKVERKEEYVIQAKEILDLHESWVTHTPIAPCFNSSLRWWETFWEGDATGASICYGHAWTIWRAEADYWYYYLTNDEKYKRKAINGFASNISKTDRSGKMYSCYLLDYIPGGGFHKECKDTVIPIRLGRPKLSDCGLTRYVWIRATETVLKENLF